MHTMKVQTKYYRLLKEGSKIIELRLFDEKRQQIKVGDQIEFSDLSNPEDTFAAQVVRLHHASDFLDIGQKITPTQAGFASVEELVQVMGQFYPLSAQKQYGVVGIEISRL